MSCSKYGCPAKKNDFPAQIFALLQQKMTVLLVFSLSCCVSCRPAKIFDVLREFLSSC